MLASLLLCFGDVIKQNTGDLNTSPVIPWWSDKQLLRDKQAGSVDSVDMPGQKRIHVLSETEEGGRRFHHTTQNGRHFKTSELFLIGIFHFRLSDLRKLKLSQAKPQVRGNCCNYELSLSIVYGLGNWGKETSRNLSKVTQWIRVEL